MREKLEQVLQDLRPGFDADGIDVELGQVKPEGAVEVNIVLRPDACEECLAPPDVLSQLFRTAMAPVAGPSVRVKVTIRKMGTGQVS